MPPRKKGGGARARQRKNEPPPQPQRRRDERPSNGDSLPSPEVLRAAQFVSSTPAAKRGGVEEDDAGPGVFQAEGASSILDPDDDADAWVDVGPVVFQAEGASSILDPDDDDDADAWCYPPKTPPAREEPPPPPRGSSGRALRRSSAGMQLVPPPDREGSAPSTGRTRAGRRRTTDQDQDQDQQGGPDPPAGSWASAAACLANADESPAGLEVARNFLRSVSDDGPRERIENFSNRVRELCSASCSKVKLGEGTFGEVFLIDKRSGEKWVVKVTPADGETQLNGFLPRNAFQMAMEVAITGVLSDLHLGLRNRCSTFVRLRSVFYVRGVYPRQLLTLWDNFRRKAEEGNYEQFNERPSLLPRNQCYVLMCMQHGGEPLATFILRDAIQGVSVLEQVACALGVAECAASFEHRDLHWGNILLEREEDEQKCTEFVLDGVTVCVANCGVRVTVIDYGLSRLEVPNGPLIFNDLEMDPLLFQNFDDSDEQFGVYRDMRELSGGRWDEFQPKTNVLWLLYLTQKLIVRCVYSKTRGKDHQLGLKTLRKHRKKLASASSAEDFVRKSLLTGGQ